MYGQNLGVQPDAPGEPIFTIFCARVWVPGVFLTFEFQKVREKDVGAVEDRNFPSPIEKAYRLYNSLLLPHKPWSNVNTLVCLHSRLDDEEAQLPLTVMGNWDFANQSHAHTVVWECCKDDQQNQLEMPYFGVCQHRNHWIDVQKNCTVDYIGDLTAHTSIWINRFKWGESAHAWNCHPRASIFLFFCLIFP